MDLSRIILETKYVAGGETPLCDAMNRLSEDPTVLAAFTRLDIDAAEAYAILRTNAALNERAGRNGVFLVGILLGAQLERFRCGDT
jgi:hypothetical protein